MTVKTALDVYIPRPDIRERHETVVRAPADVVFDLARTLDLQSIPLVHAIFWLRARMLRSKRPRADQPRGLNTEALRAMGWGLLEEIPGRLFVAGAVCEPWRPDVEFTPVPAATFASYAEPGRVKIAWTLEAEPLGPARSRFATETRVEATDSSARAKFRRYWRFAGFGIVAMRLLLVPHIRRQAERRFRDHAKA